MKNPTLIKSNSKNTNWLKIKGLTKKQIEMLKNGRLPLGALLSFFSGRLGARYHISDNELIDKEEVDNIVDNPDSENEDSSKEEVYDFEAPTHIEFSDKVNDNMEFSEAFKAARADVGSGGFFNWKGSSYNTLYKEEWDDLSDDGRQEYLRKIEDDSSFNNGTSHDHEEDEIDQEVDVVSVDQVLDENGDPVISHDNLLENLNDDISDDEAEGEDISDLYKDSEEEEDIAQDDSDYDSDTDSGVI